MGLDQVVPTHPGFKLFAGLRGNGYQDEGGEGGAQRQISGPTAKPWSRGGHDDEERSERNCHFGGMYDEGVQGKAEKGVKHECSSGSDAESGARCPINGVG